MTMLLNFFSQSLICHFIILVIISSSDIPNPPSNATIIVNEPNLLSPSISNIIAMMDIENYLYIQFDIKFVSLNSTNANQPILQIGNDINEHFPTIFLSKKLEFQFEFDGNNLNIINFNSIHTNIWYNISIYLTQTSLQYWINTINNYNNNTYPQHKLLSNKSIYIGDPWHNNISYKSDIILKNLYIWTAITVNPSYNTSETIDIYDKQLLFLSVSIIIGVLSGLIGTLICCTIIIIYFWFRFKNKDELLYNNDDQQQQLHSQQQQQQQQIQKHIDDINENSNDIPTDIHNEIQIQSSNISGTGLTGLTRTTQTKSRKRASVEFEDIYNIDNGNKLPLYISNDDDTESSTFTASSDIKDVHDIHPMHLINQNQNQNNNIESSSNDSNEEYVQQKKHNRIHNINIKHIHVNDNSNDDESSRSVSVQLNVKINHDTNTNIVNNDEFDT